jgi:formylglycine-generating enzyme required for sulfatase activity/dienelactone hydrolase
VLRSVIAEPHTPPRELNPEIPRELARIIDRALSKAPEDRYQTVAEMVSDLRSIQSQILLRKHPASVRARRQRRAIAMVAAASILGFAWAATQLNWARKQVPVIANLVQAGRPYDAYDLAVRVRKFLPFNRRLNQMMPAIADSLSVTSEPSGASVYLKRFSPDPESVSPPPTYVGTTPISNREVARGSYIVSVEKDGYDPFQRSWSNVVSGSPELPLQPYPSIQIRAALTPAGTTPRGMVFVPGGKYRLVPWNRPPEDAVNLGDYWIDRCEVTNREFKEFVDAGGYSNARYWSRPFVKDGRTLPWEEAMRELMDSTQRPGPRNWSGGTFPEGKADHPVSNVTWYEASAYAAFRGKRLPTVFQWEKAARYWEEIPARYGANSNFFGVTMPWGMYDGSLVGRANLHTSGTVPVGSLEFGMSPFGCYDMAGNVSEWCLNETSEGFLHGGGSWTSRPHAWNLYGKSPGFRSSNNVGFRCVSSPADATRDQGDMWIDLNGEVPHYIPAPESDVKKWFDDYYQYDGSVPLNATVEPTETDEWRRERITYSGADGERALAYLYVPKKFPGPHQVIHLRPAGDVLFKFRTVPQSIDAEYAPFVRSGRAVFAVVLRGYLERERPAGYEEPDPVSIEYVEENARHITDMRRGLDYLRTRDDLDHNRIAFLGVSFGGPAMVLPAIESRYGAVILLSCGISKSDVHRAANAINFAPLIGAPKLLVNGKYDEGFPLKTVAEPLFELLTGSKERLPYDGGHWPDPEDFVRMVTPWLDKTLGAARPARTPQ